MNDQDYLNSPEFIKLKEIYLEKATKTSTLSHEVDSMATTAGKIAKLNDLVSSITDFDLHIKSMIEQFPQYYTDYKSYIDAVLKENANFIASAEKEAEVLISLSKKDYSIN